MFNSLREKLKNWTKNISKSKEESEDLEEIEEENLEESKEKGKSREEKKKEKAEKKQQEKLEREEKKKQEASEKETKKKAEQEKKQAEEEKRKQEKVAKEESKKLEKEKKKSLEKKDAESSEKEEVSEETQEAPLPMKFNPGTESYEPDLEKIQKEFPKEEPKKTEEKKSIFHIGSGKVKISEKDFKDYEEDLEMLLLENNVAFEVSDEIIKKLKENIVGKEIPKKSIEQEIQNSLKEIISDILVEPFDLIKKIKDKKSSSLGNDPFVILFFGINGTGKTTSIAKISEFLKKKKLSTVLAAADTFRAASIEQLKVHGEKLGVKVIAHDYGSDPASVGFDAIQYAKKNHIDCVLIDTAGRMHTESNLIREMEKVSKVCKPDLKIFVGESITGNDATEQARTFSQNIGIDGIVLSKADIDEKGGTALSVGFITGKPILFLGTGQNYEDIEYFNKEKFLEKLGL